MSKYRNTQNDLEINARTGSGADLAMKANPGQYKPLDADAKADAPGLPEWDGEVHTGKQTGANNPTSVPSDVVAAKVAAQNAAKSDESSTERPAKSASRGDWEAYAVAIGAMDAETAAGYGSKKDLQEALPEE